MSSSGEPNRNTAVAKDSDKATEASGMDQQQKKPAPHLEEDDEFEDFPVDGRLSSFSILRPHDGDLQTADA